jgi:uncharacterized membrane protein
MFSLLALLFLISLTGFTQTSSVNPARITLTNIDVPGAAITAAMGINNSGTITGILFDSTGAAHGYLADKTGAFIRSIDFPGGAQTEPSGINEHGDIVGSYLDDAGFFHGFLLQDGNFSTIDFPSAAANFPLDIDDQGVIAGFYQDAALLNHGFTLDKAGFHTLDAPAQASPSTELFSINSKGDILGDFDSDELGIFHSAFLFSHGTFVPFTLSQATTGIFALGLNNSGDVTGSFFGDDFLQHGFISGNGNVVTFDFPGALATAPLQINSSRSVVGIYADAAVHVRSFLVTFDGPGSASDAAAPAGNARLNTTAPAGQTVVCRPPQQALRSGPGSNAGNSVCH